jgi:hypothetical protein
MNPATRHNSNLPILGGSTVANGNTEARELSLDELALVAGGDGAVSIK